MLLAATLGPLWTADEEEPHPLYFADPDEDSVSYTVLSSRPRAVSVEMSGTEIKLRGVGQGEATVTVIADDGSLTATQRVLVTVGTDAGPDGPE